MGGVTFTAKDYSERVKSKIQEGKERKSNQEQLSKPEGLWVSTLQCGSVKRGVMYSVPSAAVFGMSACSSQKPSGLLPETPLCLLSLRNEIPGVTSLNSSTV